MAEYSRLGTAGEFGNLNPTIIDGAVRLVAATMTPWPRLINWKTRTGPGSTQAIVQASYTTAMSSATESPSTGMGDLMDPYSTITMNITQTLHGLDFGLTLMAERFNAAGSFDHIINTLGKSDFKRYDTDIMSAINTAAGSGANRIGALGTALTHANAFVPGFTQLAAGSPDGPIYWVLGTPQIGEIGVEPQYAQWQQRGQAWLDAKIDIPSGYLGTAMWGVECFHSANYASNSGAVAGVMFAHDAMELHEDMPFTTDINTNQRLNGVRATVIGATHIYGVGSARDSSTANTWTVTIQS